VPSASFAPLKLRESDAFGGRWEQSRRGQKLENELKPILIHTLAKHNKLNTHPTQWAYFSRGNS
jgi:hypothetical protein